MQEEAVIGGTMATTHLPNQKRSRTVLRPRAREVISERPGGQNAGYRFSSPLIWVRE